MADGCSLHFQDMVTHDDEDAPKTCNNCEDACPGFSAHYWRYVSQKAQQVASDIHDNKAL